MDEKVYRALAWLKARLETEQIDWQIVGGLAARIHGGRRPVADIDLYIPSDQAARLLPHLQPFLTKPLQHYCEAGWDLEYCQLIYQGQKIEIGLTPGSRIFSDHDERWYPLAIDFAGSVIGHYGDLAVPVMPVAELIAYKQILGREVDLIDIDQLSGHIDHTD